MQALNCSTARKNLKSLIDDVDKNVEEYLITTKNNTKAMLISADEYHSMKETLYLLTSTSNRERLLNSVAQIEARKFDAKELLDK